MAVENLKRFVLRNKEIIMFLVGFGIMHIGWYNLQRNSALNKALAISREKETFKEYKRLEQEINENWPEPKLQKQQQSQKSGVILTAATAFAEKSNTN